MKGLLRKVRRVGTSLVITLPAHLASFYQINEGYYMNIRFSKKKITITKTRRKI
jgi:antitoxin component of MazEF toxin-antitoxin module